MIPGIDPKIDIAFKKVFGSEPWRDLTASLINAVLEPPPHQRLVDVELLNPYSEKMTLDDKLSILDIKARDDQGRLYNLEMQMLATAALVQRLLYFKNGAGLDADALREAMNRPEQRKAMGVLKMLAQSDVERELYEGRLKAKRDPQTLETMRRTLEAQAHTLETQRDQWQQRYETANREREEARSEVKRALADRICLCQRLLKRPVFPVDELLSRSVEDLRVQAEGLERDVTAGSGSV